MAEPTKETSKVELSIEPVAFLASNPLFSLSHINAYVAQRVAEEQARLEDPPEAVIARGVQMLNTPRSGPDETLVHDIWQAMLDEIRALAEPGQ